MSIFRSAQSLLANAQLCRCGELWSWPCASSSGAARYPRCICKNVRMNLVICCKRSLHKALSIEGTAWWVLTFQVFRSPTQTPGEWVWKMAGDADLWSGTNHHTRRPPAEFCIAKGASQTWHTCNESMYQLVGTRHPWRPWQIITVPLSEVILSWYCSMHLKRALSRQTVPDSRAHRFREESKTTSKRTHEDLLMLIGVPWSL